MFPGFPGMGGEEAEPPKGPGLDIERLARGILKRWWLAAGIAAVISGLFLVIAVTQVKPSWQAVAALMLHSRQDQFSLGSAIPLELQSYNLKTLLDTVKLPSSLQAVIDGLQLDATLRALSPAIGVNVGKESNIFQITAIWDNPVIAAGIANTVAELLVQRSRDLRRKDALGAFGNYSAQLESAREEFRAVTAEMRAFKSAHQVSDFNAETQVLLGSLSRLDVDLNTKIAEVEAFKEALVEIESAVKGEPEMVVTSSVYRNPLKTRLTDYEWQLQEARSRYTEQNPKVIKLQTRVDVLKQMIAESKDEGAPENLYSANTKLTGLQDRQRELTSDIRVREAQIVALTETIEQSRTKLADLTSAEKDFQLIQTRMTSAENLVGSLVGRVDEAAVMVQRNEASLELFERALPPTEAMPSSKKLIAIAGVVLGGGLGLGVALLLELLDPRLRTRRDALGTPGIELVWELQHIPADARALVDPQRPADPIAAIFRRLINELDAKLEPDDWRCLGVISADPEAGRTRIATNLALVLAMKEYPTTLVDADLRNLAGTRPSELLRRPADQAGLAQALDGESPVATLLSATSSPDLVLLAAGVARDDSVPESESVSGREPDQPRVDGLDHRLARLGSRQFRAVLDALNQSGRNLVYDLPPVGALETVLEAAVSLGNLIVVARSGRTTRGQLRETVELLEERGARVRGILVTDIPIDLLEGEPLFPSEPKPMFWTRWLSRTKPRAPAPAGPLHYAGPKSHVS